MSEELIQTTETINFKKNKKPSAANNEYKLSRREHEVLQLVAAGYSNKEIAEALQISQRTVDGHKANMLVKTNSKNIIVLIKWALSKNLIKF
jgi:DNA-binding NarL/FixJ family response regulator